MTVYRIQSAQPFVVTPNVERIVVRRNGSLDSDAMSRFIEGSTRDIDALATQANTLVSHTNGITHTVLRESDSARQRSLALAAQIAFDRRMRGLRGERLTHWVDLHDTAGVSWVPGADISRRAAVSSQYGQATIPMNAVESKTYLLALMDGRPLLPAGMTAVSEALFDKLDGNGVTDYEYTPVLVEESLPINAANGNNTSYWRRRAIHTLMSDVSQVECEWTLTLPDSANVWANTIYFHPYPLGSVDVTGLWITPDLTDSYSQVDGFTATNNAGKTRIFFPTQRVARVKVRLRQRNWIEENGYKLFEYGLQELGVQLVEWDQHYDSALTSLTDNHAFVTEIVPEDGFTFNKLYGFYSNPDYTLEPSDNRHIHFVVATDALGTQVLWDSDQSAAPQSLAAPISLGAADRLYVICTMNWVASASSGSPFTEGTPPYLSGFGLDCTYYRSA